MLDGDSGTIGQRLRELRLRRKMTTTVLAGLVGVTQSQISMWETGRRPLDRRSHISALADALQVSETDLTGKPHLGSDPQQSEPHLYVSGIRQALETNTLAVSVAGRPRLALPDIARLVEVRMRELRRACEYAQIGRMLPGVLDGLHYYAAEGDGAERRSALESMVEACSGACAVARNLGYADLAYIAGVRAEEAATLLGDPVQKGKADFHWVRALPRSGGGSWERTLAWAERAADALEPHVRDRQGIEVLGMLTLTASLAAASARRNDIALHWLAEAGQLAGRVPDDPGNWQSFCASNVDVWRVTVAVERGESGGTVLEMARPADRIVGKLGPNKERLGGFFADVGRGVARDRKLRREAVRWLRRAEQATPQRTRNSATVRSTVSYLLDQEIAAAGVELRGMAARMGIPH